MCSEAGQTNSLQDCFGDDRRVGMQAQQQQLRDNMSRSWGAAGASPNSRPGQYMSQISSW